jgi:nucleoside-diphosphate-sugar epimerase
MTKTLLIFGYGYTGRAIAALAEAHGFAVTITSRTPKPAGNMIDFAAAEPAIAAATHIITTAAPDEAGDPVLNRYAAALAEAPARYVGYLSTTGIYGNQDGAWVDEDTPPNPASPRAARRIAAEAAWANLANSTSSALDVFRLAGIYGPGRSMLDDLRQGTARRIIKPNHLFGRTHRDDIARAVVAAMRQNPPPGRRIFNITDDEPAASADVVVYAAGLLNIPPPEPVLFADALPNMSTMARSFWADNRRVANRKTKAALGLEWAYPTYREGLAAILAEENGADPHRAL